MKAPTLGWDDNRVAVYFGEQVSLASRTPTRVLPTQTAVPAPPPTPAPKPPQQSKKNNIGAIVGGTVGGVVALLIVICGFWFCFRRRKRHQQTRVPAAYPDGTIVQSSMHDYPSDPKYASVATPPHSPLSTIHSPNPSTHQQAGSVTHSSPYTTPPPAQPEQLYHHPAHGQSPRPYYPPPSDASHADAVPRTHSHEMPAVRSPASHEMPTVRSPEATNLVQPMLLRPEVGND
jgi:hypothetical protein